MSLSEPHRFGFDCTVDPRLSLGQRLALALLTFAIWGATHRYSGIWHDGVLYAGQALNRLYPERFVGDLFFCIRLPRQLLGVQPTLCRTHFGRRHQSGFSDPDRFRAVRLAGQCGPACQKCASGSASLGWTARNYRIAAGLWRR